MPTLEKVLVVDEVESHVLFFQMILEETGKNFRVFTASTGLEAEILIKNEGIHMLICAWEMNVMPGTVLIQKVREQRNRQIPCLIFSKKMTEQDISMMHEMGIEDIIGMPFDRSLALEKLKKLIEKEEHISPIEKKIRKIESFLYENKPAEALKLFDQSLTKPGPHLVKALTLLGEIWVSTRHLDRALDTLKKATDKDPDYGPALRLIAKIYSLQGKHQEAILILEKLTLKAPKNIQSLVSLGSAYIENNDHEKAKETLKKLDDLDQDIQSAKEQKGKLAFKEGDYDLATKFLAETQYGDELAKSFNQMAIVKVSMGQIDEAITIYQNAIKLLHDKAKLHQLFYNLGIGFRKKGDLQSAFEKLCESYLLEPNFEKSYLSLAKVAQEMKSKKDPINNELVIKVKNARLKEKQI